MMTQNDLGNLSQLTSYLTNHVAGFKELQRVDKFPDGQSNPTYKLTAKSGQYVLRAQPTGELLKSAHAVDREYRVMHALQQTDVPVPVVHHLCTDTTVIGRLFFVMEYVQGRVFWNPSLPELTQSEVASLYSEMNRVLASLHSVDIYKAGLESYGKAGDYFSRQISLWTRQYLSSETRTHETINELMQWLPENVPEDDGQLSLIHGDYRIDNIMFEEKGEQAVALLDWELSTLGHPFADLSYQCMQWRLPNDAVVSGLAGIDRKALGIPTEEEYVQAYCQRRGIDPIENWPFYLAFNFFRFAAIVQGVYKRAKDGNASNAKAPAYGELVPVLGELGVEVLRDA